MDAVADAYTKEAINAYLKPLEGWKPTDADKDLAYERIEWLDGVRTRALG
jgi:hypothetical protein